MNASTSFDALSPTQTWLERAVIGLNLCPFAKAVHNKGRIRWVPCDTTERAALLRCLADELQHLAAADPLEVDNTLIVHPFVLNEFLDFNDFLDVADAADIFERNIQTLERLGWDGWRALRVASDAQGSE